MSGLPRDLRANERSLVDARRQLIGHELIPVNKSDGYRRSNRGPENLLIHRPTGTCFESEVKNCVADEKPPTTARVPAGAASMSESTRGPLPEAAATEVLIDDEATWLCRPGSLVIAAPQDTLAQVRPGVARQGWRVSFSACAATAVGQAAKAPPGTVYAVTIHGGKTDLDRLLLPLQALARRVPAIAIVEPKALQSEAIRRLLFQYFDAWLPTPFDLAEVLNCARHLIRIRALAESARRDRQCQITALGLHGESAAMQRLRRTIERVGEAEAPVLILGETGTGKELVARAIHQVSRRSAGPLVAVNCGAIAPTLIQSELFGHEKHAFTGAMQRRAGSFEAADRGSVFLDEIGELPLATQPALLRVLQERSVTRLGSTLAVPVDFRLISATHVDLPKAIADGAFREDLFFRVNVLTVHVPALRERGDDILLLAESFRERMVAESRTAGPRGFDREAIESLRRHDWPGNVRELLNRVQRAVVMAEGRLVGAGDLGLVAESVPSQAASLAEARSHFERHLIAQSLRHNGQSVAGAARQLGVSRVTLYRMMARLKIGQPEPAESDADRQPGIQLGSRTTGPDVAELKPRRYAS